MTFLIESFIACALFTLFVFLMSRNPIKSIFNYPPAIIERCDQLGLVDASNRPGGVGFYVKKIVAMIIFGVLLGLLVRYVNGCETFLCGALTAYALWVVVNWFDALVLDCLWFCHDKHFIIPGTEETGVTPFSFKLFKTPPLVMTVNATLSCAKAPRAFILRARR